MPKDSEDGKKMWWILLPIVVSCLISAGGTAGLMLVRTNTQFKDFVATHEKEMTALKAEGCSPARESRTNIAVMQRDIETIKGNMAEQRTMATRQVELSQKILEKLNHPN